MQVDDLLVIGRAIVDAVKFPIAVTVGDDGDGHARVVQPRTLGADWSVDFLTNRRCRKVREIERSGRLTLLYQHPEKPSYVCLIGACAIVDDRELKRATWVPAHARWNPLGPEDPATVYARLRADRIELWSAVDDVVPEPQGYSAAVLLRAGDGWSLSAT